MITHPPFKKLFEKDFHDATSVVPDGGPEHELTKDVTHASSWRQVLAAAKAPGCFKSEKEYTECRKNPSTFWSTIVKNQRELSGLPPLSADCELDLVEHATEWNPETFSIDPESRQNLEHEISLHPGRKASSMKNGVAENGSDAPSTTNVGCGWPVEASSKGPARSENSDDEHGAERNDSTTTLDAADSGTTLDTGRVPTEPGGRVSGLIEKAELGLKQNEGGKEERGYLEIGNMEAKPPAGHPPLLTASGCTKLIQGPWSLCGSKVSSAAPGAFLGPHAGRFLDFFHMPVMAAPIFPA